MKKSEKFSKGLVKTLSLSLQVGFDIALPLIFFATSGRILDRKLNKSPLFLIFGILVALLFSSVLIYQKIKSIIKETEKEQ